MLKNRKRAPPCRVDGCERVSNNQGYCKPCYVDNGGPPEKKRKCDFEGCTLFAIVGGQCARHGGTRTRKEPPSKKANVDELVSNFISCRSNLRGQHSVINVFELVVL